MHPYLFYRYTTGRSVPQLEIRQLDGLDQALAVAKRLLSEDPRRIRVVIVRGDIEVARLERQDVLPA